MKWALHGDRAHHAESPRCAAARHGRVGCFLGVTSLFIHQLRSQASCSTPQLPPSLSCCLWSQLLACLLPWELASVERLHRRMYSLFEVVGIEIARLSIGSGIHTSPLCKSCTMFRQTPSPTRRLVCVCVCVCDDNDDDMICLILADKHSYFTPSLFFSVSASWLLPPVGSHTPPSPLLLSVCSLQLLAFAATVYLIPNFYELFINAGLFGKDLNKTKQPRV